MKKNISPGSASQCRHTGWLFVLWVNLGNFLLGRIRFRRQDIISFGILFGSGPAEKRPEKAEKAPCKLFRKSEASPATASHTGLTAGTFARPRRGLAVLFSVLFY
jgi:hypothetical protein